MIRCCFILLFLACVIQSANAEKYFVSVDGNDNGPGTFDAPWQSWKKGFLSAQAGDTVYIRGGNYPIYTASEMVEVRNRDGFPGKPVSILNYPGEKPVLDLSGMDMSLCCINGILLSGCDYWHLRGMQVIHVVQPLNGTSIAIDLRNCSEVTLEQMVARDVGGEGIGVADSRGLVRLLNCDASYCANRDGENGNGITFSFTPDTNAVIEARGCRAWANLDDGFDCWEFDGLVLFDSCWSFDNGYDGGDGDGFKLGISNGGVHSRIIRVLRSCIAFNNYYTGFDENGCEGVKKLYNCLAYGNGYAGYTIANNPLDELYNNISYENDYDWFGQSAFHSHNTWDAMPGVHVSNADFISLDASGMSGPRKMDGSLPDCDFFQLTAESDLVDSGRETGSGFFGTAPDIGPNEFREEDQLVQDTGPLEVNLDELTGSEYMVYDLSGRLVKQDILVSSLMNYELEELPAGIYVIYFKDIADCVFKFSKR